MPDRLLLTCEHGGNRVPREYQPLFAGKQAVLESHRGFDRGALAAARYAARRFEVPLIASTVTRLLVEVNRSLHHRALFSEFTRDLDRQRKELLLERFYHPHRRRVQEFITTAIAAAERVIHVGFHSFTPEWNGELRQADIGLLYDPSRRAEREFCLRWRQSILQQNDRLRVRMNYPYLGKADGLTTALRSRFSKARYVGIELEINMALTAGSGSRKELYHTLSISLDQALRGR